MDTAIRLKHLVWAAVGYLVYLTLMDHWTLGAFLDAMRSASGR